MELPIELKFRQPRSSGNLCGIAVSLAMKVTRASQRAVFAAKAVAKPVGLLCCHRNTYCTNLARCGISLRHNPPRHELASSDQQKMVLRWHADDFGKQASVLDLKRQVCSAT
jgi:hypothetical protein